MKTTVKGFFIVLITLIFAFLCLSSCSKEEEETTASNFTTTERATLPPWTSKKKHAEETEKESDYDYSPVISPTKTADGYEVAVAGGNGEDIISEKDDYYMNGYTKPSSGGIITE